MPYIFQKKCLGILIGLSLLNDSKSLISVARYHHIQSTGARKLSHASPSLSWYTGCRIRLRGGLFQNFSLESAAESGKEVPENNEKFLDDGSTTDAEGIRYEIEKVPPPWLPDSSGRFPVRPLPAAILSPTSGEADCPRQVLLHVYDLASGGTRNLSDAMPLAPQLSGIWQAFSLMLASQPPTATAVDGRCTRTQCPPRSF